MGQIEDLRLYVTIVDQGSIARAAEAMNIAKSAVSRRLAQLESRYDTRLIDRQPRLWEVTKAGQELYQRAVTMVADAEELEADFMHTSRSLRGPLRVSIAREFGMSFLRTMLHDFIRSYPEVQLTVDLDDRTVDLDRENYDLALRVTSEAPAALISRCLGTTTHGLFASQSYLLARGTPQCPDDLLEHALLNYGAERRTQWGFRFRGKPITVAFQPALNSSSGPFLLDAAINGFGIIRLPEFVVADALARGGLVPVLPESEFQEFGIYTLTSPNRRISKRMRVFLAAMERSCAGLGR